MSDPSSSEPDKKVGWLGRLTAGLRKSSAKLVDGIGDLVTKRKLDDDALADLEDLLITADLGAATAARLTSNLAKTRFGKDVTEDEVRTAFAEDIAETLAPVAAPLGIDSSKKPFVILVVGVNGAGKTTTIGKLTKQFRDEGHAVTLVAGDTFRAAAVEQLQVWGQRTDTPVVARETGADAAGLAFDALNDAEKRADDILLIDTAGRLQNKDNLMAELAKIVRVIKKKD